MSRAVILTPYQWANVYAEIKKRERPSVVLSRSKMKEVLGFTVRDHREYVKDKDYVKSPEADELFGDMGWYEGKVSQHTVHLDFYDEAKRTMFLLKYGNGQD
jgi:hypothetical protein